MNTTTSRHLTKEDLYRTILLEEGCDVVQNRQPRPARRAPRSGVTVYAAQASRWVPQFRVLFGDGLAG